MVANITELCDDELGDEGIDLSMVTVGSPLLGDEDSAYREFITPGMICVAIFFLAMALTSESFITERSQGLLERSWITGVLPVEIIASYIMSQFLVMVMQVADNFLLVSINIVFFSHSGHNNIDNSVCRISNSLSRPNSMVRCTHFVPG